MYPFTSNPRAAYRVKTPLDPPGAGRAAGMLRWAASTTAVVLLATFGAAFGAAMPAHAVDSPTTVTLTFDDANLDQLAAASTMNAKGLPGTFFIPTGFVGQPNYMTQANLATLKTAGNEIAGHTLSHPDLTLLTPAAATSEICNDRSILRGWGYDATSFAYPFASVNPAVEAIVKGCGYNSARGLGDTLSPPTGQCAACQVAETIPPADPYLTKAPDEVDGTWDLARLQQTITQAVTGGGGWVQLTFHHICDGCQVADPLNLAITPALFDQFTTWLASWKSATNTVKTVTQVIGGAVQPAVAGPPLAFPAPAAAGVNGVVNPSLETAGTVGTADVPTVPMPQCWSSYPSGANTATFATVTPGHTGTVAMQMTMTGYANGDSKMMQPPPSCSPGAVAAHTYSLSAWYQSSAATQFAVYTVGASGVLNYWTSSPLYAAATTWTQATFTTPAVPAGTQALSFGLNLMANGTLTTDDYAMYDSVGSPIAPTPTTAKIATRLGGADAYGTSALISQASYLTGAPVAYIATGATYQDALSGAAAAGRDKGPVLLVAPNSIPGVIAAELTRLKPVRIVVLGGNLAISDAVMASLQAYSPSVTRLGGADAYGTSAAISQATYATGVPVAYVATGATYQDALSGAAPAGMNLGPVLLVAPNSIPGTIAAELTRLKPLRIVVLGGNLAISDAVMASLQGYSPSVTRLGGADAYGTSALISQTSFATAPVVYLATGATYQDALSGAAPAGMNKGPVLLVQPNGIPPAIAAELTRIKPAQVIVLGGNLAISDAVMTQALALIK